MWLNVAKSLAYPISGMLSQSCLKQKTWSQDRATQVSESQMLIPITVWLLCSSRTQCHLWTFDSGSHHRLHPGSAPTHLCFSPSFMRVAIPATIVLERILSIYSFCFAPNYLHLQVGMSHQDREYRSGEKRKMESHCGWLPGEGSPPDQKPKSEAETRGLTAADPLCQLPFGRFSSCHVIKPGWIIPIQKIDLLKLKSFGFLLNIF